MGVKEEVVKLLLSGLKGGGLAGAQLFEHFDERFLCVAGLVLLHGSFELGILAEEAADIIVGAKA